MYYIIYLSAGAKWFSEEELEELLKLSKTNNRRNNITGLLLYGDGNFIQLLEGEEEDVMRTYRRISLDKRHGGITPIASGQLTERNFPEWEMGFKPMNSISLAPFKGYFDPANEDFLANKENHITIKLLKAFARAAHLSV